MTMEDLIADLGCASPPYVPAERFPAALVREALAAGLASEWRNSPAGRAIVLSSLACECMELVLSDADITKARWVHRRRAERPARPSPAAMGPAGCWTASATSPSRSTS